MANPNCEREQEAFAEVTVIDSQFQHFSNYIDIIRVFKCRICSFCSPLEHVIASHMSEVHFPRRNYLCKQCLFVFEDRDQLTSHLESAHGTKSVNVCFGDGPNYASPPPSWRVTRSEDDGMSRLTIGDERGLDEGRNGRVTSSTGNLANIRADDVRDSPNQGERMEHSGSSASSAEPPQQQTQSQSAGGSPHNKYLGNGSCHPSSSSQDDCEIVGTQPAKELSPGETPIQRQENQDYIKAEPVSPARRYFPPTPRISIESVDEPRTDASPAKSTGNQAGQRSHVSPVVNNQGTEPIVSRASRMLNRSTTIALSPTGDSENELALARPVQPSFTSYIIRQSSLDGGDDPTLSAGTSPDGSDRVRPQDPPLSSAGSIDLRMPSQNSPIYKPRQGMGRLMSIRRQDSIEEGRYGQQMDVSENAEPPTTVANRPTAEVPPVTQATLQATDLRSRSHRLTFKQMANQMLENQEKRSLDPSQPLSLDLGSGAFPGMAGLQKAGRPRSFSISEGDTRALYSGLNSEYPATAGVRVPGATTDRERHPYGLHLTPGWHYPGIPGYQSLSVDAGAAKYWNFPNHGPRGLSIQDESSSQTSQSEDGRDGGSMEGSVLFKALQNNETVKQGRRNPGPAANALGVDGPSPTRHNHSLQHPWTQRRGLSEMTHRMPWNHGSPPFPFLSQREHSVESLPPSSHKNGSDNQVFHHKRFRSMERSASEGHNSTANPHRKVGGQGISSESSQDLAQADDITRQVQQVMEGTNTLYSARDKAVPIWTEEQHSPQGGSSDSIDKDDMRRRSRKSTFNIYREIPERKRKLDRDEEEKIKHSYNPDGSFDYFTLTGWKAYKCDLCKKRRFKTASELDDHKRRKHGSLDIGPYTTSAGSPSSLVTSASCVSNMTSSSTPTITTLANGISNGNTAMTLTSSPANASPKSAIEEYSNDSNKMAEEPMKTGAGTG